VTTTATQSAQLLSPKTVAKIEKSKAAAVARKATFDSTLKAQQCVVCTEDLPAQNEHQVCVNCIYIIWRTSTGGLQQFALLEMGPTFGLHRGVTERIAYESNGPGTACKLYIGMCCGWQVFVTSLEVYIYAADSAAKAAKDAAAVAGFATCAAAAVLSAPSSYSSKLVVHEEGSDGLQAEGVGGCERDADSDDGQELPSDCNTIVEALPMSHRLQLCYGS
jgi:hypothetical protein